MASRGSSRTAPRHDPTEWAKRLSQAKERAAQLKAQRSGVSMEPEPLPPSRKPSFSSRTESIGSGREGGVYDTYPPDGGYAGGGYDAPDPYGERQSSRGYADHSSTRMQSRPDYSGTQEPASYRSAREPSRDRARGTYDDVSRVTDSYASHRGDVAEDRRGAAPYGSARIAPDPYASHRMDPTEDRRGAGPYGVADEHPGYRGMVTFGSRAEPPLQQTMQPSQHDANPWGAPLGGRQPAPRAAAVDPYGPSSSRTADAPKGRAMVSAAPKLQEEVDETFHALLRSDDAPPRGSRVAASRKKPEWNSDYAPAAEPEPYAQTATGPTDLPAGSTAARLARMRAELGTKQNSAQSSKQYAGLVESERARPANQWDEAPLGGGKAEKMWDDQPVGGKGAASWDDRQVGGKPTESWDEQPIGSKAGGSSHFDSGADAPSGYKSAPRELARTGRPAQSLQVESNFDHAPAPAASKLSLLKSKMRAGSARSLQETPKSADYGSGMILHESPVLHDTPPKSRTMEAEYKSSMASRSKPREYEEEPRMAPNAPASMDERPTEPVELIECGGCGRKFNPTAIEKHSRACAKVFQTKRAVFDSKAQALPDEALALAQKGKRAAAPGKKKAAAVPVAEQPIKPAAGAAGTSWEAKSSQLREAMKAARAYKHAKETGAELPPPVMSAPDPSLVPCPHCGRSFSDKAAERHIPKCSSIKAKPTMLKKGAGVAAGAAGVREMERAAAASMTMRPMVNEYEQEYPPARAPAAKPPMQPRGTGVDPRAYARYDDYTPGASRDAPVRPTTLRPSAGSHAHPPSAGSYGYASDLLSEPVPTRSLPSSRQVMGNNGYDSYNRSSGASFASSTSSGRPSAGGRASMSRTTTGGYR